MSEVGMPRWRLCDGNGFVMPSLSSREIANRTDALLAMQVDAMNGGTRFPLASRPFNDASLDMGRPPQTSRAYSRTGRAALAAGTLSTVGDDVAREDVKRYVEVSDADRDDTDVMHDAEMVRQARLRRWQAIR